MVNGRPTPVQAQGLRISVEADLRRRKVRVDFYQAITWIELQPDQALQMAQAIIAAATAAAQAASPGAGELIAAPTPRG